MKLEEIIDELAYYDWAKGHGGAEVFIDTGEKLVPVEFTTISALEGQHRVIIVISSKP